MYVARRAKSPCRAPAYKAENAQKALEEAGYSGKRIRATDKKGPIGFLNDDGSWDRVGDDDFHEWIEIGNKVFHNLDKEVNGIPRDEFYDRLCRQGKDGSYTENITFEAVGEWCCLSVIKGKMRLFAFPLRKRFVKWFH